MASGISNALNNEGLADKHIAFLGFSAEEAAPFHTIFRQAGSFCRLLSAQDSRPSVLDAFDLALIHLTEELSQAPPLPLLEQRLSGVELPFLLVGSRATLHQLTLLPGSKFNDFMLETTWTPDELTLRALKLLLLFGKTKANASSAAKQTIVIADDDSAITSLLTRVFNKAGFATHTASDGIGAVELAWQLKPELMIVDVNMPRRDGFEVLSAIRLAPEIHSTKILMLTACEQERDMLRGFGMGVDDYVIKPFNPMELSARVKCILSRN